MAFTHILHCKLQVLNPKGIALLNCNSQIPSSPNMIRGSIAENGTTRNSQLQNSEVLTSFFTYHNPPHPPPTHPFFSPHHTKRKPTTEMQTLSPLIRRQIISHLIKLIKYEPSPSPRISLPSRTKTLKSTLVPQNYRRRKPILM